MLQRYHMDISEVCFDLTYETYLSNIHLTPIVADMPLHQRLASPERKQAFTHEIWEVKARGSRPRGPGVVGRPP